MRVDIHNHTTLCNHATGTKEEYIKKAIELNIDVYGFSDHAPMNFDKKYRMDMLQKINYENNILSLKEKYKNEIDILLGYEVDFMSNHNFIEKDILNSQVDYLIGSIHFLNQNGNNWGFDNPEFIGMYKNQNIDKIWEDYFNAIEAMAKIGYFDIVGHLDLIKVFKYLPNKDIKSIALKSLKAIKKSNMVIEVNSAGLRKPIKEQYPSNSLLELAYELEIPITFGSDAHSVDQVGFEYDKVISVCKKIGYTKCAIFNNRDIELVKF